LRKFYFANLFLLFFLPLNAESTECGTMCPTTPYDLVFGPLTSYLGCGTFTLDVGVTANTYPIDDIIGINIELNISNYMDFELNEALTDASINPALDGLEIRYPGFQQIFFEAKFSQQLASLDYDPNLGYAFVASLIFEQKPGTSTNISYALNSTILFDKNGDGFHEPCFPDALGPAVPVNSLGYIISGEFETMNTQNYSCGELVDVYIEFSDAGGVLCHDVSDFGGEYESCGLCPGGTFRATPISGPLTDTLCGGAIDTSDLAAVHQHLLGTVEFTYVWQYFAADCNNSGHVSIADVQVINKAIQGLDNSTYVPWTYWTKASVDAIINPTNYSPGEADQYWEFSNLSENKTMKDFYGVRTMQVHLNGQPCNCANNINSETQARALSTAEKENLLIKDRYVQPGEQIVVSIRKPSNATFMGFDINLKCENGLEIQHLRTVTGINPNKIAESYSLTGNKQSARLMFSHVDPEFLKSTYSGDLLQVTVQHTGFEPLWLSQMLRLEEIHGSNYIRINQSKPPQLNLLFTASNFEEVQVVPNPVGTDFRFYTDSKWENLTVFDLSGKALRGWDNPITGVIYSLAELPAGVYVLRFDGSSDSRSVRIIKR
jgi:hypothetical protein